VPRWPRHPAKALRPTCERFAECRAPDLGEINGAKVDGKAAVDIAKVDETEWKPTQRRPKEQKQTERESTSASDELGGAKQSGREHDVRLTGRRIVYDVTDWTGSLIAAR
jgi:hypothetical protein